jgi:hypothetical protein
MGAFQHLMTVLSCCSVVLLLNSAMPQNVQLLRHSLCLNPALMDRIALFGLGEQQQQ